MKRHRHQRARVPAGSPVFSARWKHLSGTGLSADYRAICGRPSCFGCLGELSYRGSSEQEMVGILQFREWLRRQAQLTGDFAELESMERHLERRGLALESLDAVKAIGRRGDWARSW